jgi:hydroxyacylglutathione hydrolase
VLDTRPPVQFGATHVPGSIHIGLSGQFASWAARLLGIDATVVLVAEDDAAIEESRVRLARVGLEKVAGALAGGILAWVEAGKPIDWFHQVSVQELAESLDSNPEAMTVLDVREPMERQSAGVIPGSIGIPLPDLAARIAEVDRTRTVAVHCKSGYRSSIAASLLQSAGFQSVANVVGGYDAWALSRPSADNAREALSAGRA